MPDKCPRCGNTTFREIDCGPDGYDDDITYVSYICTNCGLWYSGWSDSWRIDVSNWREEEDAEVYETAISLSSQSPEQPE